MCTCISETDSMGRCLDCGQLDNDDLPSLYHRGQTLRHKKSGGVYTVKSLPRTGSKLEYCHEPYYVYLDKDGNEWLRRRSEMEDGRFEPL